MGVKYFGQFLLERGLVRPEELRRAIALQQERNFDLGKICTTLGFLSHENAERLNQQQRFVDKRFGELAIAEKLMTTAQLEQALRVQERAHLPLGRALVEIKAFDGAALDRALAEFKDDQAPFSQVETERLAMPPEVTQPELAQIYVDLCKKLLARVARVQTKAEVPTLTTAPVTASVIAAQRLGPMTAHLGFSDAIARQVMTALLGFSPNQPSRRDDEEGTRDFLNVVTVNVASKLAERGKKHDVLDAMVVTAFPARALHCPLVVPGDATIALVLAF